MVQSKQKIIGQAPKLQEVLRTADLIAGTDVPVLITGETGTGKDLFAHRIHDNSKRRQRPFIGLNCSLLKNNQYAESVLFGHKKGAFAGADESIKGLVAKARSGTLYLDNIDALPLNLQSKLLQLIETGEIQPLGSVSSQACDVRIIAASSADLSHLVDEGAFRADLYYRLNVIPLELPALKERENDIALLIEYFFNALVREKRLVAPTLSKAAIKQVMQYNWPGNIRELKNFSERMFILFSGKQIDFSNLPRELRHYCRSKNQNHSPFELPATGIKLDRVEVDLIIQALDKTSGNKSQAARLLGLTRDTFLYRLKKYSISS